MAVCLRTLLKWFKWHMLSVQCMQGKWDAISVVRSKCSSINIGPALLEFVLREANHELLHLQLLSAFAFVWFDCEVIPLAISNNFPCVACIPQISSAVTQTVHIYRRIPYSAVTGMLLNFLFHKHCDFNRNDSHKADSIERINFVIYMYMRFEILTALSNEAMYLEMWRGIVL